MPDITLCDCRDGCQCAAIPGPAVHLIEREGVKMKVCSRCILGGDYERDLFSVNRDSLTLEELVDYDPIAGFLFLDGETMAPPCQKKPCGISVLFPAPFS